MCSNKFFLIYLFLAVWVFVDVSRLSLVEASRTYSSLQDTAFSLQWLLLLGNMGSKCSGSVIVAHGLSYSKACGIFPDQGLNPCSLYWQADS